MDRQSKEEKTADFIRIVVWGKQAENCGKYLFKGKQVAVNGRIQTGSYKDNKSGNTVYTTDVIANNVEFLGSKQEEPKYQTDKLQDTPVSLEDLGTFSYTDEGMPF